MYLCKNLRISCLAAPSSSHDFANSTFNFSALPLTSCPFSLRHKSMVCRTSIPTASRDPTGVIPFLCRALRPSPLLTWKSSKLAWRFSVTCAAAIGWSPTSGKKILQKKSKIFKMNGKIGGKCSQGDTARKRFSNTIKTSMRNEPSNCLWNFLSIESGRITIGISYRVI